MLFWLCVSFYDVHATRLICSLTCMTAEEVYGFINRLLHTRTLLYQEGSLIIITWQVLPACTSVSQQHIISHKQPRQRRVWRHSIQRSKEVMVVFLKHCLEPVQQMG